MKNIRERVEKILIDGYGLDESDLVDSASFETDLGLDSLDRVEMVMNIEKEFLIAIPDEIAADSIETIGALLDYLEGLEG
jgi:acyl carrier protein